MPEYNLPFDSHDACERFADLDEFTRGYVQAAFFCGLDEEEEIAHYGAVHNAPFDDLAPTALATMIEDCADFQKSNAEDLAQWSRGLESAGINFWFTRNGHGAGFWDRGEGELGDRLSEMARPYGEASLYVGDDGLIYIT